MNLAERLPEIWYGKAPAPSWLRALVPVYGALRAAQRAPWTLGLRRPQRLPIPVVVIGNLTVGGTGKTPLTIALVEALRARGRKPGVVSRGYGGAGETALVDDGQDAAARCGDEPALIRRATGAAVAVGRDRLAAARLLLERSDCDVAIADDGLQHLPLHRDVEICVIDGERRFGNGLLLPAGPLREPVSRLATVDFRVCNGGTPQADEIPMRLTGDVAIAVSDPARQRPLRDFAGARAHAVAGIGNPARFFATLRRAGLDVIAHPFADHRAYAAQDLDFGDGLPVLMTTKDAIKCTAFARPHWWSLPVRAELPATFFDAALKRIG